MRLKTGDRIRIKSPGAIARTLDENGTLAGLPFMPEMLQYCGRTAVVHRSAHKTCDAKSIRRFDRVVHLQGLRCDGQAHGGCQMGCFFFWHEDWLEPDQARQPEINRSADGIAADLAGRSVRLHGRSPDNGTYACQATELTSITTELPWWSPRQYLDDIRSGNVSIARFVSLVPLILFNGYQEASKHVLPRVLWIRGGRSYPSVIGRLRRTPAGRLDLRMGERVSVKSRPEILQTLDRNGANRGLTFDWEMLPLCGQKAVVSRRVSTVIEEQTGRLRSMPQPCVILEGVSCTGRYHRFCPRSQDSFWREIWLERSPADEASGTGDGQPAPNNP